MMTEKYAKSSYRTQTYPSSSPGKEVVAVPERTEQDGAEVQENNSFSAVKDGNHGTKPKFVLPNISKAEESCIKSALAFVVVRRRTAMLRAEKGSSHALGLGDPMTPSPARTEKAVESASSQALSSLDQSSRLSYQMMENPFLRGKQSNDVSSIEKKHAHLESMVRVAITTTLPLYEDLSTKVEESSIKESLEKNVRQSRHPLIYEFHQGVRASVINPEGKTSTKCRRSHIFRMLDGVAHHLATALLSLVSSPMDTEGDCSEKEKRERNSTVMTLLHQHIFSYLAEKDLSDSSHSISKHRLKTTAYDDIKNRSIQMMLATSSFVHALARRMIFAETDKSLLACEIFVRTICQILRRQLERPSYSSTDPEREVRKRVQQLNESDVRAVNLLLLLEAIISMQLEKNSSYNDDFVDPDSARCVAREQACRDIFQWLHFEMEGWIIPVPRSDMAKNFLRGDAVTSQDNNIATENEGNSICSGEGAQQTENDMPRNSLIESSTLESSHKAACMNVSQEMSESALESRRTRSYSHTSLSPTSKMMIQLSVYDLIQKLAQNCEQISST